MRQTITINGQVFLTPTFIGVGAPKCATTWISQVLRGHPEVFVSNPKELHFFVDKNWLSKDASWYLRYFEKSGEYKMAGEFTTNYLVNSVSAERIYELLGPIKIIVSVRNPVDRFFSHFRQKVRNGSLPRADYPILDLDTYHQVIKSNPNLLTCGDYYYGIRKYGNIFGMRNVLILVQEDIRRNAQTEFVKLCEFLEINRTLEQDTLNRRVLKGTLPKHRTFDRSARRLSKYMDSNLPGLVNYLRRSGLFSYVRKKNARSQKQEMVVDEVVREEIAKYYQSGVGELEDLLGRSLEWKLEEKIEPLQN